MPKPSSFERAMAQLRELALESPSAKTFEALQGFIGHKNNHVAAKAVELAEEWEAAELTGLIVDTFYRFMDDPSQSDKGCVAKTACVETLEDLSYADETLFLTGLHHVQREPVYGGSVDTAGLLRAACARALADMNYPEIHFELATLLMDETLEARRAAVEILGWICDRESELLLRMKVLAGDEESEIVSDCFSALMLGAPEHSLEFVAGYVHAPAEISDGALLALGESRLPAAFERLKQVWDHAILPHEKERLLLPMAVHRSDESFNFMINVVATAHRDTAAAALRTMGIYSDDKGKVNEIRRAVSKRSEDAIGEIFIEVFEDEDS